MARTRYIRPSFFKNEELADLHPEARLLFIGLWCFADRDGRLEDRPRRLKADILPYSECPIDELLNSLDGNFIVRYEADNGRYIQINNWSNNAKIHPKEVSNNFPAIPCRDKKREGSPGNPLPGYKYKVKSKSISKSIKDNITSNTQVTSKEPLKFPDPLDTPECREAWEAWLAHRAKIKKPYKNPDSQKRQLRRLAKKFNPEEFIDAIDHSIAQGWTGIFEDKDRNKPKAETNGHHSKSFVRNMDLLAKVRAEEAAENAKV